MSAGQGEKHNYESSYFVSKVITACKLHCTGTLHLLFLCLIVMGHLHFYMFDTNVTRCFYKVIVDNEAISKAAIVGFWQHLSDNCCHNWRFDGTKNIFRGANRLSQEEPSVTDSVTHSLSQTPRYSGRRPLTLCGHQLMWTRCLQGVKGPKNLHMSSLSNATDIYQMPHTFRARQARIKSRAFCQNTRRSLRPEYTLTFDKCIRMSETFIKSLISVYHIQHIE